MRDATDISNGAASSEERVRAMEAALEERFVVTFSKIQEVIDANQSKTREEIEAVANRIGDQLEATLPDIVASIAEAQRRIVELESKFQAIEDGAGILISSKLVSPDKAEAFAERQRVALKKVEEACQTKAEAQRSMYEDVDALVELTNLQGKVARMHHHRLSTLVLGGLASSLGMAAAAAGATYALRQRASRRDAATLAAPSRESQLDALEAAASVAATP